MKLYKILLTISCLCLFFSCAASRELENPFDEKSDNYINLNNFADYMLPPNDAAYTWLKPTVQFGYKDKKIDGYKVFFAEDENFTVGLQTYEVVSFGGSFANVTFDKADIINKDYYWKYQVKWNGFYFDDISRSTKFRIRNFFLKYPSTAGSNELTNLYYFKPIFEWENMRNNNGFDLEISQDVNFLDATTIKVDVSSDYTKPYEVQYTVGKASEYKITYRSEFNLIPNKDYYWRCKLKNETEWALKQGSADQRYERFKTYVLKPFLLGVREDSELKAFVIRIDSKDGEGNEYKNKPRFNIKVYHKTGDSYSKVTDISITNISYTDINDIRYNLDWNTYKSTLKRDGTKYYVVVQAEEEVNGVWYPSEWDDVEYYTFKVPEDW